jgi:hypothetical protein
MSLLHEFWKKSIGIEFLGLWKMCGITMNIVDENDRRCAFEKRPMT